MASASKIAGDNATIITFVFLFVLYCILFVLSFYLYCIVFLFLFYLYCIVF